MFPVITLNVSLAVGRKRAEEDVCPRHCNGFSGDFLPVTALRSVQVGGLALAGPLHLAPVGARRQLARSGLGPLRA